MMGNRNLILIALACCIAPLLNAQPALPDIDYKKLVARADLHYDKPVSRSEEGMPIGNGVMGSLVWTTPSTISFQVNRVDVFGNSAASNNFYERHTDYCGGTGFADIDFIGNIFSGENFSQHLSCYAGINTIESNGVKAEILAWHERDVMAIRITDNRPQPTPVISSLRALRAPVTKKGNHSAISEVSIAGEHIALTQTFTEDEYYCASALLMSIAGSDASPGMMNDGHARLVTSSSKTFTIYIASAATFNKSEDVKATAVRHLEEARRLGFEALREANAQWWQNFWSKAFVSLHSADGVADGIEKHYTYYLYVMASSSRGTLPPKFNGMLWTTGGDTRKWGGLYWGANQGCLYNGLFPANRLELLQPMFNLYTRNFESCSLAARQQWGSQGIYIPETMAFDGMPALPDDIAAEMRELYLVKKKWENRSVRFNEYAYNKMPFQSRWNWKKDDGWNAGKWETSDKGGGPFGHVTHIFSRGAKIAYQYWLMYEYSQDREWLRTRAYPMLKGIAEFYRNFPNLRKESDGKYHLYHVNDNESVWGGHNTVEEISSMMAIFPVAIKASELLGADADLRPLWKEVLSNLSPLPTAAASATNGKPATWARSLEPMVQGSGQGRPDGNTMPVWFFDLCTLEADATRLATAQATYDLYFPKGINAQTPVYVLSRLAVTGAQLGRAEATKFLIPNQIATAEISVMPNRMDLREGVQTTTVQRLGRAAEALHHALCQSNPESPGKAPVIRVFPAWPALWNARFNLLCRGGFKVGSSIKDGNVGYVEVTSLHGGTCLIRNPWPGKKISVYRKNRIIKHSSNAVIAIETQPNDNFLLLPEGISPADAYAHANEASK